MTSSTPSLKHAAVDGCAARECLDFRFLSEDERVAFYGALFAVAAVDGGLQRDESELIFETIEMTGVSEPARQTIWDYIIAPPSLSDCLKILSTHSAEVRCACMVYLVEVALVDGILSPCEDEVLLQARRTLSLTQKQIQAIERFICEEGLIRPRPRDFQATKRSLKRRIALLAALSIPTTAVYVFSLAGGLKASKLVPNIATDGSLFGARLALAAIVGISTAAYATSRLLRRHMQKRAVFAGERRRRAQLAVGNLQDAVAYLSAKAAPVLAKSSTNVDQETFTTLAERLSMLQLLLTSRQSTAGV